MTTTKRTNTVSLSEIYQHDGDIERLGYAVDALGEAFEAVAKATYPDTKHTDQVRNVQFALAMRRTELIEARRELVRRWEEGE